MEILIIVALLGIMAGLAWLGWQREQAREAAPKTEISAPITPVLK